MTTCRAENERVADQVANSTDVTTATSTVVLVFCSNQQLLVKPEVS
jgi:hypothetical protein